jgi:hypothetical protein
MGRITAAVIIGFVLWSVLWLVGGMVVTKVMPESTPAGQRVESAGVLLLFVALSMIISFVSGFTAVKIASSAAMKTAWILAVVLLIVGIGVEISGWHTTPAWYHIVFLVLLAPCVIGGARLGAPKAA